MTAEIITLRDGNDQGRQLPPPGMNTAQGIGLQTPGYNAGSFSSNSISTESRFLFPFDPSWRTSTTDGAQRNQEDSNLTMLSGDTLPLRAKKLYVQELPINYNSFRSYPVDPITGLPYPILPIDHPRGLNDRTDYHHPFHPRAVLEETGTQADIALRVSRGQDLERWLHQRYHDRYDGLLLPSSPQDKFAVVVLACAGVVSRQAMYLGDERNILVPTSEAQYQRIRGSIHYEYKNKAGDSTQRRTKAKIGSFFAQYALEQNIRVIVSDNLIDRFLSPRTERERLLLGNQILTAALEIATEPVREKYLDAFHEGLTVSQTPKKMTSIIKLFFPPQKKKDYFDELQRRIAA